MAVDPLEVLKEGIRAGDRRAMRIYFDVLCPGRRPFDPGRLVQYAEKKARSHSPRERARHFIGRLNPRDRDYLGKARLVAKYAWERFGMTEGEAVELVNEAQEKRWRAKNGLEHRFLMALLRAPSVVQRALSELEPSDFVNPCHATLFATWRERGELPSALTTAKLRETQGDVPGMTVEWWIIEATETLAEMLARRSRWSKRAG